MNKETAERIKRLRQEVKDLGRDPKDYRYDHGSQNAWRREKSWVCILCSNNKEALVNWQDFVEGEFQRKRWGPLSSDPTRDYPHTTVLGLDDKSEQRTLHQAVMGKKEEVIDHINGDHYDCRRWNLRHGSVEQNNQNRHPRATSRKVSCKTIPLETNYVPLLI